LTNLTGLLAIFSASRNTSKFSKIYITKNGTENREQGTDKKLKFHQFKAQSRKRYFSKMRSPKKTVSFKSETQQYHIIDC
jgi:hypothetical protein